jgi:alpha-L-rhamnosidase
MEAGRNDLAYEILTKEDYPGYLHMVNSGGTAMWEGWLGGTNSRNHLPLSSVGVWFYQALGGIRPDPSGPGFKKIIIKPAQVGDLTSASASYRSVHGTISTSWEVESGSRALDVTIPGNTTATVWVPVPEGWTVTESGNPISGAEGVTLLRWEPGTAVCEIGSGSYHFVATD